MIIYHVFLYVMDRKDDWAGGLRETLGNDRHATHKLADIHLSRENYALVDRTEYSDRRFLRLLYYRRVFKELEALLGKTLQQAPSGSKVVIYLADETVWAEFLDGFCQKFEGNLYRVTVQHGFMYPQRPKSLSLFFRRLLNRFSVALVGYPALGLGFGSGVFDVYLVYSEVERAAIQSLTKARAFACPKLIKKSFLDRYKQAINSPVVREETRTLVLFALPHEAMGGAIRCSLKEIFQEIAPLAKYLAERLGMRLLVRFHPGSDRTESLALLRGCELGQYVSVDEEEDVVVGIARSQAVMAYNSTTLFEAGLVGRVPIGIIGKCCVDGPTFPHEVIRMDGNYEAMLDQAVSEETRARYPGILSETEPDWGEIVTQLVSG